MGKTKDLIQKEVYESLKNVHRGTAAVSMGVGKTLMGIQHVNHLLSLNPSLKVLVVAPKKSIFTTWIDECDKHGYSHVKLCLHFSTYISLSKQSFDYDLVVLDECHNLLFSHSFWLTHYSGKIIGFTGTPPVHKSSEKYKMINAFCPIVYDYIVKDAVSDKILNDYKIIIHKVALGTARDVYVSKNSSKKGFPTTEKLVYEYWSRKIDEASSPKEVQLFRILRMKAMMTFPSKERFTKSLLTTIHNKCIVFANTHEQADRLCKYSYHSSNPESEENLLKFKAGIIKKMSAVLQLNEGVNIEELKEGIILHAYGNERKTAQRIGRLLRLNPNDEAIVHILCYEDTIDEVWIQNALKFFDQEKIEIRHGY